MAVGIARGQLDELLLAIHRSLCYARFSKARVTISMLLVCSLVTGMDAIPNVARAQGPEYNLDLFEGGFTPYDGSVNLNDQLRAVASTDDPEVDQVTFTWFSPFNGVERQVTTSTMEDTFSPNILGLGIVEADFQNGTVLRFVFYGSFLVIPESPVGAIAIMLSSMAALIGFTGIRAYNRHQS